MTADLAIPAGQEAEQRLPIGLLISTGAPKPARGPGRPIDHFRFKEGELGQYAEAAALAREHYGEQPKALDDVLLLSNVIGDTLEIRIKAWSKSGLRIWGKTNFATLERDEYLARVEAWDDEILYFPRELKDVPKRLQADWQGEPIEGILDGPDDARIKRFEMRVEATLKFGLPKALGLGKVALYSTSSKRNARNLYEGVWFAYRAFEGRLIGVPFRLRVEPRKTSYFDKTDRAYKPTSNYQVTFTTPFTMQEAIDAIREQREALGAGPPSGVERLALPAGDGPQFFRTDDREQDEAAEVPFVPVEAFDAEQRAVEEEPEEIEGEAVEESDDASYFEQRAAEAQKRGQS